MAASRKPLSNNPVVEAVAGSLARHVGSNARLVVALSGGIDSVVLLHALLALQRRLSFQLRAVHVHHGLSPHADDWAAFCQTLCEAHAVPLDVHRVSIARDDPSGIEAAARRERRKVFAHIEADAVLTAHQQGDQAETLLLQLLRGAGPKGLAAMAEAQRPPGWHALQLRPLLTVSRADIEQVAATHGIEWVEDESNQHLRYRRNALRHRVMPLLAEHFPGAESTLARAAGLQAEAAGLLDDLAQLDGMRAIRGERLDCAELADLSPARGRNLLRHFIEQQGQAMPSERRLDEALHQLVDARQDARVCVRLGETDIRRFRGGAYLVPVRADALQEPWIWTGEELVALDRIGRRIVLQPVVGAGLRQSLLLEAGRVEWRVRQGGERIRLAPGGAQRSLKNVLQESAIPPWERDRLPLLLCDGKLVWAEGIGIDADCLAGPGEPGWVPVSE